MTQAVTLERVVSRCPECPGHQVVCTAGVGGPAAVYHQPVPQAPTAEQLYTCCTARTCELSAGLGRNARRVCTYCK